MLALETVRNDKWVYRLPGEQDEYFRLCKNYVEFNVCNWAIPAADLAEHYCLACRLNHVIPNLSAEKNRRWWASMETSKRRLLYTLLQLGLPIVPKSEDPEAGLAFAFLEDRRTNPLVSQEHVLTGHAQGLITVNLAEADHAARESARVAMNEPYRTLLGHFRHESGHYYWEKLIENTERLSAFRDLFGDERQNYDQALQRYYTQTPSTNWQANYVSAYAQAQPLEDWAESWAHYLHMTDTLDTAADYGIAAPASSDFDQRLEQWTQLTVIMNALNRSMGLNDAYPFVLSAPAREKLRFVHQVTASSGSPTQSAATHETPL